MSEHSIWSNGKVTITVGDKIGLWEVLGFVNKSGRNYCHCRCKCGKEREVRVDVVAKGGSNGCQRCRVTKHGGEGTPECKSWQQMLDRCYNPQCQAYDDYGGRGITVCDRWREFANFLEDMGLRPLGTSLDRYPDNNGNYEPGNCRWATQKQQNRNKRDNTLLTFDGRTMCIADWADETGLHQCLIAGRVGVYGWSVERALMQTPNPRHGKPRTQYEKHRAWKAAILNSRN